MNGKYLLFIAIILCPFKGLSQQKDKFDCIIIKAFIAHALTGKYFHPVYHKEDSLIFNDVYGYLDDCNFTTVNDRPIVIKSFPFRVTDLMNEAINIVELSKKRNVYSLRLVYNPTGSTVFLTLKKKKEKYIVCGYVLGSF